MSSHTLSPCQKKALKILQENRENVFLTGVAGSGKSFLIQEFLKSKNKKIFPVLASTGTSAVLLGGRTFHSFFGLGILEGGPEETLRRALKDRRLKSRLSKIEGFVLDEVSMISGPTLGVAENLSRILRDQDLPWGGLRVICVGDFAQLPPVNRYGEKKQWAFLEEVWINSQFRPLVLNTIIRTQDQDYLRVLNYIRQGIINEEVCQFLDGRTDPNVDHPNVTHLFAKRKMAESFNLKRLEEICQPLIELPTSYHGKKEGIAVLKKNAPIPEKLLLKKSALVMIRINDPKMKFVNGSLGFLEEVEKENIVIRLLSGRYVDLKLHTFSLQDANGEEIAEAVNFPINLAYASTIHKAQGTTLEKMVVDLKRLWEPGQAYVALSRLKNAKGLTLTGWSSSSIRVEPQVISFYKNLTSA